MKNIKLGLLLLASPVSITSSVIDDPLDYGLVSELVKLNSYTEFLHDIGFAESGNDYSRINTLGYLGKYQFGESTLRTLKYTGTTKEFINSQWLQEHYMSKNLKYNHRRLESIIKQYDGTIIDGNVITTSGILAAAHLAGQGNVKKFFKFGKNPNDKYGTRLTDYLFKFSGYTIKI